jgi:phosphoribosylamine--glycine ligase
VDGIADSLNAAGVPVFGPGKIGAQLEGSKAFTKHICDKYNIPTSSYREFDEQQADEAKKYVTTLPTPIVVKADGLAAGKGVIIAQNKDEAIKAIDNILVTKEFGSAGNKIVIEEFLEGEEISVFAISDGKNSVYFGSAQDHKKVGDGDTGPNTGGMGAYAPAPIMTGNLEKQIMQEMIEPTVRAMQDLGAPYRGVLFAGIMVTKTGPKLIEFNSRFGDPETQVLMARLKSDLVPILLAAANGDISKVSVQMRDNAALCVVMAAKGYPGDYQRGTQIKDINKAEEIPFVNIFHAGTRLDKHEHLIANGGRVLGVTAIGRNVTEAQISAYKAVDRIKWPEGFCRRDIGWRATGKKTQD